MFYLQLWRKRLAFQICLRSVFQLLAKVEEDRKRAVTIGKKLVTKREVVTWELFFNLSINTLQTGN